MSTPWFPLYASDFVSSTVSMPPEVVGAYIRLLCYAWNNNGIPDDPGAVSRIAGGITQSAWFEIKQRLERDPQTQRWVHPRMERERQKTESITAARRASANNTNAKKQHGDRSGDRAADRSGDRDGDRAADRPYPQPQPQVNPTPLPPSAQAEQVGGGSTELTKPQKPDADCAGADSPPKRLDAVGASKGIPAPKSPQKPIAAAVLRIPTNAERERISRWQGSAAIVREGWSEWVTAQRTAFAKVFAEKQISAHLVPVAWEAAIERWAESGSVPVSDYTDELFRNWVGIKKPDSIISFRLRENSPSTP